MNYQLVKLVAICITIIFSCHCSAEPRTEQLGGSTNTSKSTVVNPEPMLPTVGIIEPRQKLYLCFDTNNRAKLKESEADCSYKVTFPAKIESSMDNYWTSAFRYWRKYIDIDADQSVRGNIQQYGDDTANLLQDADRLVVELRSTEIITPVRPRKITTLEAEEVLNYLSRAAQENVRKTYKLQRNDMGVHR